MFTPSTSKIRFVFILYSPSFPLLLNLRWFYIFLLPWLIANWFYFSSKPPPYFNSSCFFVTLVCILEERNNIGAMESLSHSLILFESVDKLLWGVEGSFSLLRFEEKFDFQFSGRWPRSCTHLLTIFQVTCRDLLLVVVILSLIMTRDSTQSKQSWSLIILLVNLYASSKPLIKTGIGKRTVGGQMSIFFLWLSVKCLWQLNENQQHFSKEKVWLDFVFSKANRLVS